MPHAESGLSLERQREIARENQAAKDREVARFLESGGTQQQLDINKIVFAIKRELFNTPPRQEVIDRHLRRLKAFLDAGVDSRFIPPPFLQQARNVSGQQVTTTPDTGEDQFLHAPTDTFEAIGIQADPLPVSDFPKLFNLKLEQSSYTAQGTVRIRVSAFLITPFQSGSVDAQLLIRFSTTDGVLKKQVRKNINFTPNSPQQRQVDVITTVDDPSIKRIGVVVTEANELAINSLNFAIERAVIPDEGNGNGNGNGQGTGRLEGNVVLEDNHQIPFVLVESTLTILQNRFNELRLKKINVTNTSSELGTIPVNILLDQIRQHNLGHEPSNGNGVDKKGLFQQIGFETLIIGGLAVAALMPRGDKKK